jgi:hypothetical protein
VERASEPGTAPAIGARAANAAARASIAILVAAFLFNLGQGVLTALAWRCHAHAARMAG